ncbi:hypothetical protein M0813_06449 [Anaeramoeba flamelloides]|uniref:UDENN FLCN/SMCR8-type domain-containing protein n=1 Tax=Anaeramoeba flamelloides TaxID=1746091 RepID=A0ABQ8XEJ3_9EUKA|nr:hypothetical protein M0813_06449 [Anaeramoeba flamelloides]
MNFEIEESEDDYDYFSISPISPLEIPEPEMYFAVFKNPRSDIREKQSATSAWKQQSQKQFEDFIVLSQFCEQQGPVLYQVYPNWFVPPIDLNDFVIQIMSTDYQGSVSVGSHTTDSEFVISLGKQQVFAYVHHFTIFDIFARGYTRQLCFSYVSSSRTKIMKNLHKIQREFLQILLLIKAGNRCFFLIEIENRIADLKFTLNELIMKIKEQKKHNQQSSKKKMAKAITPLFLQELIIETKKIRNRLLKTFLLHEYDILQNYLNIPKEQILQMKINQEKELKLNKENKNKNKNKNKNQDESDDDESDDEDDNVFNNKKKLRKNNLDKKIEIKDYEEYLKNDHYTLYLLKHNYQPIFLKKIHKPFTIDQKLRDLEIICIQKIFRRMEYEMQKIYEKLSLNKIQITLENNNFIQNGNKKKILFKIGGRDLIDVLPIMKYDSKTKKNMNHFASKETGNENDKVIKNKFKLINSNGFINNFDNITINNNSSSSDKNNKNNHNNHNDNNNNDKNKNNDSQLFNDFLTKCNFNQDQFYQILWLSKESLYYGKDILLSFNRVHWCLEHFVYCLLIGEPVLISAKPINSEIVKLIVNAFSLFIPGNIERGMVVLWKEQVQKEKNARFHEFSIIKLAGISKKLKLSLQLKKFFSIIDFERKKFYSRKPYKSIENGIVQKIIGLKIHFDQEKIYIAYFYKILSEISLNLLIFFYSELFPEKVNFKSIFNDIHFSETDLSILKYWSFLIKKEFVKKNNSTKQIPYQFFYNPEKTHRK